MLASASADLSIKIFDVEAHSCTKTLYGHDHTVSGLDWIDSDVLVSCSRDNSVKLWDLTTGYCSRTIYGHSDWVRSVKVSKDLIVTGSNDQTLRVYDRDGDLQCEAKGHSHVVECIAIIPEKSLPFLKELVGSTNSSGYVASGSRDKTIKIFDLDTGACVFTLASLF